MKQSKLYYILLIFLLLVVFLPTLEFKYLNYDDKAFVMNELVVQENPFVVFSKPTIQDYIPITMISFWIERKVSAENTKLSHAINLILHLINTVLLFSIVQRFTSNMFLSFLITSLWSLNPTVIESVVWVSERKGLLAQLFLQIAIGLSFANKRAFSLFFCFLAVLSKPVALPAFFVWLVFYLKSFSKIQKTFISILIFVMSVFFVQLHAQIREAVQSDFQILSATKSGLFMIGKWFWPFDPSPYYAGIQTQYVYIGLFVVLISVLYLLLKKNKAVIFCWGCAVIFLIPQLKIWNFGLDFVAANRYLYLPSYFYLLGLGFVFNQYNIHIRRIIYTITTLIVVVFICLTLVEKENWKDSMSLWSRAFKSYPTSSVVHNNLGLLHMFYGDQLRAKWHFGNATVYNPLNNKAWWNLGQVHKTLGDFEFAEECFNKALKIDSNLNAYKSY